MHCRLIIDSHCRLVRGKYMLASVYIKDTTRSKTR